MTDAVTTGAPKLWVILARAHGALASYVESRVSALGLCLSDFMVLEVLLHKGPLTISTIGAKVLLASPSMTSAVDRLEALGYVVRTNSTEDRRSKLVALTPSGRSLIEDLYARHADDLEEVFRALSAKERKQLRSSLKTIGLAAQAAQNRRVTVPGAKLSGEEFAETDEQA